MRRTCNRDCFNCRYKDCVVSTVTVEERQQQDNRDKKADVDPEEVFKAKRREQKLRSYHKHKHDPQHIQYRIEYREKDREHHREVGREYYQKNKEEISKKRADIYYSNLEENRRKSRERRKRLYHENLEESRRKQREYRARKKQEKLEAEAKEVMVCT